MQTEANIVLEIKNLTVNFMTQAGELPGIDNVSLRLAQGETLAIAGESGCGKSVTAMSILQLLPEPPAKYVGGQILFKGTDLLSLTTKDMTAFRGNEISMIFQEPMTALNPVLQIGDQIMESLMLHQGMSRAEAKQCALAMIKEVGIPDGDKFFKKYPHQLSGGMRQRVMIAMALACKPSVLIADEPTTALDVTVQAQVLMLLEQLKQKNNTSIILITHDMGVVAQMAQKVMIMYAGRMVEYADVFEIFARPLHPYTQGLLDSIPSLTKPKQRLYNIEGTVPSPREYVEGCRFAPRCERAQEHCELELPPLTQLDQGHQVCCWRYATR